MIYMMDKNNETNTGWNMMFSSQAIMAWIKTTMKYDEKWNERTKIKIKNSELQLWDQNKTNLLKKTLYEIHKSH